MLSQLLQIRASGLLLHPTSLPGGGPIGGLGRSAFAFVDFLKAARQRFWQMLPVGATTLDGSPYRSTSAFAGNPWLINTRALVEMELLPAAWALHGNERGAENDRVNFELASETCKWLLERAHAFFDQLAGEGVRQQFDAFRQREAHWLTDFAQFSALREFFGLKHWCEWPNEMTTRMPMALSVARAQLHTAIEQVELGQFLFDLQWTRLKKYANENGILLVGDIPIYVADDSADVWANQALFRLDKKGRPTHVAGVPPDYFSETGQRWGNPLYRWDIMEMTDYDWWVSRFRRAFQLFDVVRIDHFRGFDQFWEVPAKEETAINGRWVDGPGTLIFKAVESALGPLAVIAEDLGTITPTVTALREKLGFPGMRVLQFGFSEDLENPHLLANVTGSSVVYPGTHDNDTAVGWYGQLDEDTRERFHTTAGGPPSDPAWTLIEMAWDSPASLAVAPVQDILSLDSEARMNTPGVADGNWSWRCAEAVLTPELAARLAELSKRCGRAHPAE